MPAKETLNEILFTRAPGSDKLRKSARGRLNLLVGQGWHEVGRKPAGPDSIQVALEREGHQKKLPPLRRVVEPAPRRRERGGPGGQRWGGPGGPGQRFGGPGAPPGQRAGAPGTPPGQRAGAPGTPPGQRAGAPGTPPG